MNLLDLKKREFDRSEFWQYLNLGCSFLIYGIGILTALFKAGGWLIKGAAALTTVIQLSSLCFRHKSVIHADLADEIRRRNDFAYGLGIQPSREEVEDWHLRVGNVTPGEVGNERFFSTDTKEPGPRKLLEAVKGSAFFTSNLAGVAAKGYGITSVGGFLFAIFILITFVLVGVSEANLEKVSQAVIASMGFWAAGELAWFALCYYRLSQAAKRIRERCAEVLRRSAEPDLAEAIVLVGEYNSAAAQCPPLPGLIYKLLQEPLNRALESAKRSLNDAEKTGQQETKDKSEGGELHD